MAGLGGANYGVYVNFGIRNMMAGGMREVQAQLKAAQAAADSVGKKTAAHLKKIQAQASAFGGIYGNPKSYEEAKRNLDAIAKRKGQLQNALAVEASRKQRQALNDQLTALSMTERDVRAKAKSYGYVVAEERTRLRMANAQQREQREQERARQRQIQQYHGVGSRAFKVAEYSGIGALGIGGLLFESGKAAAQQQQLAATTAMVLGLRGSAFNNATMRLMSSQLKTSMDVGMLSSADIAAVQTQLAMHTPGLGLKGLLDLTPFVAKYADVMKMTLGADVQDSAKTAAMAANVFGARSPQGMRDFLNRFFVMEQSTGVDQDTAVKALTQYGAMGKALGFSNQDMLDLYGAAFRLGAGGGKAGARLAAVMRGLGSIPTTVVKDYFESKLGLVGNDGIPTILKQGGQLQLEPFLRGLHNTYERLIKRDGIAKGKAEFITGLNASYGAAASNVLFPLIQAGSLQQWEQQRKRESQFYSIEQAQASFFHMPINNYQRFLTNVKTFVIEFGTYVLPLFNEFFKTFADKMQSWTEWMAKHPESVKKLVSGLVNLGEILAAISASSAVVGAIARIVEGFIGLNQAMGLFKLAMAEGRLAFLGPLGIVAAVGLAAWYFRDPLIKALDGFLHWLQGLPVIGKFFGTHNKPLSDLDPKTGWNKTAIAAAQHAKTIQAVTTATPGGMQKAWNAFKSWWDWMHSDSIPMAPSSSGDHVHHVTVNMDGKRVGAAVVRQKNRAMRGAIRSTTNGQGTSYLSSFEHHSSLSAPNVR